MTYGQYRYFAHVNGDQPGGMHTQRSMDDCFDLGFLDEDGLTDMGRAGYKKAKATPPARPLVRSHQL